MSVDKFNFFIPLTLEKGSVPCQEMKIKGIASSEVEDSDEQILVPSGFDVSALLSKGFLNYNHKSSESAAAIIGEPTVAEIINNGKDLYIEGFLYPDSDEAKSVYKLAQTLEKNSPNRRLGFSIEGKSLEVDPFNKKRVTKARITGIAITAMPKNPNTLLSIIKGDYSKPFVNEDDDKKGLTCKKCDHDQVNPKTLVCLSCGFKDDELDKAMTAASGEGVWQNESINEGQKEFEKLQQDKKLTKSQTYDLILNKYSNIIDQDLSKAVQIYELAQEFNQKKYNMEKNTDTLSKALENAFSVIDSEIEKIQKSEEVDLKKGELKEENLGENSDQNKGDVEVIKKSDEEDLEDKKDSDGDDEDLEKAYKAYAFSKLEKGYDSVEILDNMMLKGFDNLDLAKFCIDACLKEIEESKENGGDIAVIKKSEDDLDLIKSELQKEFNQNQDTLIKEFDLRFQTIGKIIKSQSDELSKLKELSEGQDLVKYENEDLKKSIEDLNFKVEELSSTPIPTKSLIKSRPIERFDSNNINDRNSDVFNLKKSEDIKNLTERLSAEFDVELSKGIRNEPLGSAIFELSVAKSLDMNTLKKVSPFLQKMNIKLTNE